MYKIIPLLIIISCSTLPTLKTTQADDLKLKRAFDYLNDQKVYTEKLGLKTPPKFLVSKYVIDKSLKWFKFDSLKLKLFNIHVGKEINEFYNNRDLNNYKMKLKPYMKTNKNNFTHYLYFSKPIKNYLVANIISTEDQIEDTKYIPDGDDVIITFGRFENYILFVFNNQNEIIYSSHNEYIGD